LELTGGCRSKNVSCLIQGPINKKKPAGTRGQFVPTGSMEIYKWIVLETVNEWQLRTLGTMATWHGC
jgi:hypothetical protein